MRFVNNAVNGPNLSDFGDQPTKRNSRLRWMILKPILSKRSIQDHPVHATSDSHQILSLFTDSYRSSERFSKHNQNEI